MVRYSYPRDYLHVMSDILKHVEEKIDLTSTDRKIFLSLIQRETYPRKTCLLTPGDVCRNQYFVSEGCLRVFYLDGNGGEHNVKFAPENWWAFDIESFFDSTPAYYGIDCLENTKVLMLNQANHATLLGKVPAFERFYRLMMQQSFIALQHRMTQSLSLSAEERYLRFQNKYPSLESRVSQRHIASYLGITPVFLSMLRKQKM